MNFNQWNKSIVLFDRITAERLNSNAIRHITFIVIQGQRDVRFKEHNKNILRKSTKKTAQNVYIGILCHPYIEQNYQCILICFAESMDSIIKSEETRNYMFF